MKKKNLTRISLDNIWNLKNLSNKLNLDVDSTIRYLLQFYNKNLSESLYSSKNSIHHKISNPKENISNPTFQD